MLLDVNVLLAAHRDDHPQYPVVGPWFERLVDGEERFAVPHTVWTSFVRIATHRRIFTVPTPVEVAFNFVQAVRAQPKFVSVVPGSRHLEVMQKLCREGQASGDLVPDADLAAFAVGLGCELVSLDRDFARFPGLRWRLPGAASGRP